MENEFPLLTMINWTLRIPQLVARRRYILLLFRLGEMSGLLVDAGADTTTQTKVGSTSLQMAARNGHLEALKTLLTYNADPNATMPDVYTALHRAVTMGYPEIVNALLDAKADVSTQT
jgi:ankyrin repeat protein